MRITSGARQEQLDHRVADAGRVELAEAGEARTSSNEQPEAQGDEAVNVQPERLSPERVRQLSQLAPWISTAHIALEWCSIVGAALLCQHYFHPLLYLVVVAFIGARQHGLLILGHDAAHYRLFKNRGLNDWVGEAFLVWPFVLLTMQQYRRNHFPHHRELNTALDPDWVRKQTDEWRFPKSKSQLVRMLVADALGIGFIKLVIITSRLPKLDATKMSRRDLVFKRARLAYLFGAAGLITWLHGWLPVLAYWVVPYLTWMQLAFHLRSIAEHFAIRGREGVFAQTRTVRAHMLERMFLIPKNVGYHVEHHLYPSVPFYRLGTLHRELMGVSGYAESVHVSSSYLSVLRECNQRDSLPE